MLCASRWAAPLIAVSLLGSATMAHAACGWVLWNDEARLDYGANTESRFWHTIASTSKQSDCEARLRGEIAHVSHPEYPPKAVRFRVLGDAVQIMYFRPDSPDDKPTRLQTFRYVCLPGNIDPRAAKGK